jgi:hypothetical protein
MEIDWCGREVLSLHTTAEQTSRVAHQSIRLIITVWRLLPAGESALQDIEIEYNQKLKALETVLSGVRQPGDFFVCGAIEMPMPRVEIEDAGTLSFPVPDAQIAAIVRRADRAPYGNRFPCPTRRSQQLSGGPTEPLTARVKPPS